MSYALRVAVALGALYALTLASTDPVDLLIGTVLGGVLVALLRSRLRLAPGGEQPSFAGRVLWFPAFAAGVLADIVVGTWDVALRVLHVRPIDHPGLVRVPIGDRTQRGVAVSALTTTLSPGTVLVDVDWERGDMLLHVMDASDPDGVRRRHQQFYDRFQRRVFP